MPFAHACVFLKHLHCFSLALQVCTALQQLAKRATLPFASLGVAQLASFFTAALQYQFPADVGKRATGKVHAGHHVLAVAAVCRVVRLRVAMREWTCGEAYRE